MRRSPLALVGLTVAAVIVAASILVRFAGPADPLADATAQRTDVEAFHALVRAGRWSEVHGAMAEPPGSPRDFAALMRDNSASNGAVTAVRIDDLRLLRSRTAPLLEVRETVTVSLRGRERTEATVSYFVRDTSRSRWVFGFSAPARAGAG